MGADLSSGPQKARLMARHTAGFKKISLKKHPKKRLKYP